MSIALFIAAVILITVLAFAAVALVGRRSLAGVARTAPAGASGAVPRRQPGPTRQPATAAPPEPPAAPPVFDDITAEPEAPPAPSSVPRIDWYTGFDARSGELDDVSRLRLIGDLGVIGKEWCVPLLSQAYAQEPRTGHRQAALTALAACRLRTTVPAFERAIAAGDPAERAIATDALADLEPSPAPQPKRTRTVERY